MLRLGWNARTTKLARMSGIEAKEESGPDDAVERITYNKGSIAASREVVMRVPPCTDN